MPLGYATSVGSWVTGDHPAWEPQLLAYIAAAKAQCPLERATTRFVLQAADGNGAGGGGAGTEADPYRTRTPGDLDTLINSQGSGVRWRLRRGDEWVGPSRVRLQGGRTLDAYGVGPRPHLSNFTLRIEPAAGAWTDAGGGRWTASLASPGWVRERRPGGLAQVLRKVGSAAEVAATPRSWWHDGALLHLHPGTINPNAVAWEATAAATPRVDGLLLTGDGNRVSGLRVDGFGLDGVQSNDGWQVKASISGDAVCVVEGCELYYASRHTSGVSTSTSGGRGVWLDNEEGLIQEAGGAVHVDYASSGLQEAVVWGCRYPFGSLPQGVGVTAGYALGDAVLTHTDETSPNRVGLAVVGRCVVGGDVRGLPPARLGTHNDVPGASNDPASWRSVRYRCVQFAHDGNHANLFVSRSDTINCNFDLVPPNAGTNEAMTASGSNGRMIGCRVRVDTRLAGSGNARYGLFNCPTPAEAAAKIVRTWIHWVHNHAYPVTLDRDNKTTGSQTNNDDGTKQLIDCLVTAEGSGPVHLGFSNTNDSARLRNVALRGISNLGATHATGYEQISGYRLLTHAPAPDAVRTEIAMIQDADITRIAAAILANPSNKVMTDAGGAVATDTASRQASKADVSGLPAAVRTELAAELARLDATVSSRLEGTAYVEPDNAGIAAVKAKMDNLPTDPASVSDVPAPDAIGDELLNRVLAGNHDVEGSVGKLLQDAAAGSPSAASIDPYLRAALFGKSALTDNADGTKTERRFAADGTTPLLDISFNAAGEVTDVELDPGDPA